MKVSKPVDAIKYQSMVGSLIYTAIAIHPDILQAVGEVSKYNSDQTEAPIKAFSHEQLFSYDLQRAFNISG